MRATSTGWIRVNEPPFPGTSPANRSPCSAAASSPGRVAVGPVRVSIGASPVTRTPFCSPLSWCQWPLVSRRPTPPCGYRLLCTIMLHASHCAALLLEIAVLQSRNHTHCAIATTHPLPLRMATGPPITRPSRSPSYSPFTSSPDSTLVRLMFQDQPFSSLRFLFLCCHFLTRIGRTCRHGFAPPTPPPPYAPSPDGADRRDSPRTFRLSQVDDCALNCHTVVQGTSLVMPTNSATGHRMYHRACGTLRHLLRMPEVCKAFWLVKLRATAYM